MLALFGVIEPPISARWMIHSSTKYILPHPVAFRVWLTWISDATTTLGCTRAQKYNLLSTRYEVDRSLELWLVGLGRVNSAVKLSKRFC